LRNLAVTASVLAWLAVLGPATFLAGILVAIAVRSSSDQLALDLGIVGAFASPAGWLAAAMGAAAWLKRARTNAVVMSAARHRLSENWAVIGWFLPIVHLVVPPIMITDIVRAGRPAGPETGTVRW
jgi:hypothetical protein